MQMMQRVSPEPASKKNGEMRPYETTKTHIPFHLLKLLRAQFPRVFSAASVLPAFSGIGPQILACDRKGNFWASVWKGYTVRVFKSHDIPGHVRIFYDKS